MNEEEYFKERLDDQINWYDRKSQTNQRWYKNLRLIEVVSATLIPFWAGIGQDLPYYQISIASLGVIIAVSVALSTLNKYQEHWVEYRTTAETLKHEKYLYQTKCKPYTEEDSFQRLVQRV